MYKLLIYIPTYNRLEKLKVCLNSVINAISGYENEVAIHVSDNNSSDGTSQFLQSLNISDKVNLKFDRNSTNIGLVKNVVKVFDFDTSNYEFTWIIGDDDYLLKNSIGRLIDAIKSFPTIDFYFLNSIAYNENQVNETLDYLNSNGWEKPHPLGNIKSKFTNSFACDLQSLLKPEIDEVLGGSLMCYAFRSRMVTNKLDLSKDNSPPFIFYYPHTLNFIYSLTPETQCIHLSDIFTFNFWHKGVEWGFNAYDKIVCEALGHLIFEQYQLNFITEDQFPKIFQHYLNIATPSLKKLIQIGEFENMDRNYLIKFLQKMIIYKI